MKIQSDNKTRIVSLTNLEAMCSNPGCSNRAETMCSNCEQCEDHCSCSDCANRRCGARVESVCEQCGQCGNCCRSVRCDNCGEYTSTCENGYSGSCCNCDSCPDSELGPLRPQESGTRIPANKLGYRDNPLTRMLGIELELSEVANSSVLLAWAQSVGAGLVEDDSLADSGVEITTKPASGDILLKDCNTLKEALRVSKAVSDRSCGLHVHVDAQDYTSADLRKLILLYASIERALFELVSRSRHSNTYCVPCGHEYLEWLQKNRSIGKDYSKQFRTILICGLYSRANANAKSSKRDRYQRARYKSMNLHSYFYRKTIEFRLHEGNLDTDIIYNWALLCGYIVERAYAMSEKQITDLIESSETCDDILRKILPPKTYKFTQTRLDVRRTARRDTRTLKPTERDLEKFTGPLNVVSANVLHHNSDQRVLICAE